MKNSRILMVVSLCLVVSAVSFGQANFSGSWALNESKSNFGDSQFRMASPTLTITQDATTFSIEKVFRGQDGEERKSTEKYTLDGKQSVNPMFNSEKKSTATWAADKKSLTVASVMVFEFNGESSEIKTTEVYKLSESDKLLTIDTQSVSSRGERKTLAAYDKK